MFSLPASWGMVGHQQHEDSTNSCTSQFISLFKCSPKLHLPIFQLFQHLPILHFDWKCCTPPSHQPSPSLWGASRSHVKTISSSIHIVLRAKKHPCNQFFRGLGYHNLWVLLSWIDVLGSCGDWLKCLDSSPSRNEWTPHCSAHCTEHLFLNTTSWFKPLHKRLYHNPLSASSSSG